MGRPVGGRALVPSKRSVQVAMAALQVSVRWWVVETILSRARSRTSRMNPIFQVSCSSRGCSDRANCTAGN